MPTARSIPMAEADRASSQTVKAQLALRDLILSGGLKPGDRVSELSLVDRLGMSRTPIRMALVRLEDEGFLEAIPSGGFAIKAFTERAQELAEKYGERFSPPALLLEKAEKGEKIA